MDIIDIGINKIKPYSKNAKKHPQKQIDQVAASIKRFGWAQPLVIDKNSELIIGHARLEAAKKLGYKTIPVVRMENLSQEEVKALRLADNKLNESEWDMNLAIGDLKGLSDEMFDLTGFDKDLLIEPDEKDDEVPDVPAEPKSKLGDLYELGSHRVLVGDSTKREDVERLMDGKKADMVFTDPPYGILYLPETEKLKKLGHLESDTKNLSQFAETINKFTPLLLDVMKGGAIFYIFIGWEQMGTLIESVKLNNGKVYCHLVWNRHMPTMRKYPQDYLPCHENFIYGWKDGANRQKNNGGDLHKTVWEINRMNAKDMQHTTEKPVALPMNGILNSSKQDDIILDLFLGSGSTLIAAQKTGRICYGMEIDPKYVDVIVSRYCQYVGNNTIKKNSQQIEWKN